jgi:peptidoglycan DL-endopeptidase CwlO
VASDRSHGHPHRTARLTIVAVATALLVVLASSTNAYAEPSPAEIEAQIDKAWNTLEPLVEQYNQVHAQLVANQAKAAALQKQLEPLQAEVDRTMSQVSDMAVGLYKAGPASAINALLSSGSPTALADQLALLNMAARGQRDQISAVANARDRYAADKKVLDDLIAQQARQDTDLAARKKDIENQLANLQKLRQQAYGAAGTGTGVLKPVACPVDYLSGPGATAAKKACSLIGKPYIWGAAGPNGYDCSGLTLTAWAAAGVTLRHYTKWQWEDSKPVVRADLRLGDLVFYYSDLHHMGIYVGGGWMVHAPHPGDYVRMAPIDRGMLGVVVEGPVVAHHVAGEFQVDGAVRDTLGQPDRSRGLEVAVRRQFSVQLAGSYPGRARRTTSAAAPDRASAGRFAPVRGHRRVGRQPPTRQRPGPPSQPPSGRPGTSSMGPGHGLVAASWREAGLSTRQVRR